MRRETLHDADGLRFKLIGPAGTLEQVIRQPDLNALVHHDTGAGQPCDGRSHTGCDAEMEMGDEITLRWKAADCDDAVIWAALEHRYTEWTGQLPDGGQR